MQVIRVLFRCFKFCEKKNDGMFLHEAKQILRKFLLLRPRTLDDSKKVFSRCNFSENSVQALSSVHSNVKLLYLFISSSASPSSLLKIPNDPVHGRYGKRKAVLLFSPRR